MKNTENIPLRHHAESKIKKILPRTLFGRVLLIIVTPLILMQAISTFVFFDRHWDTMTRRLSHTLAGDIAFIVDSVSPMPSESELVKILGKADDILHMKVSYSPKQILVKTETATKWDRVQLALSKALGERVRRPFAIKTKKTDRRIKIDIQLAQGVLGIDVHQKRLYSSTPYIFLMWMIGSSLVLFAIAIVFMRNQIRPIRRLAVAARNFGTGRDSSDLKPSGATEVRQATRAFRQMQERIKRHFAQRTEMLAGVSHDLRTPLTRMKLQIEMLDDSPEIRELGDDVHEMERMIDGYLAFARGEGTEKPVYTDLTKLVVEVVAQEKRDGSIIKLSLEQPNIDPITLRPQAIKRAITNLITNGKKYATSMQITMEKTRDNIFIIIDDDGPGIVPEHREDVFRAFFRLDPSRNPKTGGTGLGLTIARDIVQSHGGELTLNKAPIGGLRATIELPL
ncbi:MAG: two-component sensor histidine kinase [Rhodospirillaceae bacterium]|nr:two-component sensor histidine kinase [Rhodospirillaceae bacterium]